MADEVGCPIEPAHVEPCCGKGIAPMGHKDIVDLAMILGAAGTGEGERHRSEIEVEQPIAETGIGSSNPASAEPA